MRMTPCSHNGCENMIDLRAKSGLCLQHYNAAREAKAIRCKRCLCRVRSRVKSGYCRSCIHIVNAKTCAECKKPYTGKSTVCGRCVSCRAGLKVERDRKPDVPITQRPYNIADLIRSAAQVTWTAPEDIKSLRRLRHLVYIRFAIMHLARPYFSSLQIGAALNRDHSTVVHGWVEASNLMARDTFATMVETIRTRAIANKARDRAALTRELERLAA